MTNSTHERPPLPEGDLALLSDQLRGNSKFLHVCLSHSWGGLEQTAAEDALEIARQDLPIRMACLEGSPLHEYLVHREKEAAKLSVLPLDFTPRDYFDLNFRKLLLRELSEQDVSIVHSQQIGLLWNIAPWLWSRPRISLFASRYLISEQDKRNFLQRAIYSRLDGLLVMSESLRRNVLATHPIRERRVRLVSPGLDFEKFDPDRVDPRARRAAWGADEGFTVIGLVGRIHPTKGQETFIKAAAGLLRESLSGHTRKLSRLKFVMVGEETLGSTQEYLAELRAMVQQFRIQDHVVFSGYEENLPEVMRALDLLVMPSKQESFGLVALEAMAMECPVILSDVGSAREWVGEQEFGLTVRPEDAFDLQRQIRFILDKPELARQMGSRARQRAIARFGRKARLFQLLSLYERAQKVRQAFAAT
ncbi:MAG: glycosyltransferase family 4 protein [Oligoflexia bacterium]|jgi:glycosyltransferase involved in cell wall biosynthesis